MRSVVINVEKKASFNHETSELNVTFVANKPLKKEWEKLFYNLPANRKFQLHIYGSHATILDEAGNIIADRKVKPIFTEFQTLFMRSNGGVLNFGKYSKKTEQWAKSLVELGAITSYEVSEPYSMYPKGNIVIVA